MSKHTPGPWNVTIDDCGPLAGRPGVFASEDIDCAVVHWDGFIQQYWGSARGDKEIHANARLIAAAPDLLEALAFYMSAFGQHLKFVGQKFDAQQVEADKKARAAIAKATGEDT